MVLARGQITIADLNDGKDAVRYTIIPHPSQVLRDGSGLPDVEEVCCDVIRDEAGHDSDYAYEDEIQVYVSKNDGAPEACPTRRVVVEETDNSIEFYLFNKDSKLDDITFGSSIFAYLTGMVKVPIIDKGSKGTTIILNEVKYAEGDDCSESSKPSADKFKFAIPNVAEGKYLWTWTHIEYSDGTSSDAYSVSRMGIDGKGLSNVTVDYCEKDQGTLTPSNFPESDWGDYPSPLTEGRWLYVRTKITYNDGQKAYSYSCTKNGAGSYYAGLEEYYAVSDNPNFPPLGYPLNANYPYNKGLAIYPNNAEVVIDKRVWIEGVKPSNDEYSKYPYLWNFEISYDSSGNKYVTYPNCIGNYAKGIQSIVELYAISSESVLSDSVKALTWTDEQHDAAPTDEKPYQWNKTITTYNTKINKYSGSGTYDETTEYDTDITYHVSAVKGAKGDDGEGVSQVTEEYGVSKDENTQPEYWGTREYAVNLWDRVYKYLWNKETTTYKKGMTPTIKTHVVCVWSEDGRGIVEIENWYKASNLSSGVTRGGVSDGWSKDPATQTLSSTKKYLWNYEKVIYTSGDPTYTTPTIKAYYLEGQKGSRGATLRISEWNNYTDYQCGAEGEEFIDIVSVDTIPNELFLCKVSHKNIKPSADTIANTSWSLESKKVWAQSDVREFFATRILWTEQVRADVISLAKEMSIVGNTYVCHFGLVDGEPNLIWEDKNGNVICRVYQNGLFFPVSAEGYLDKAVSSSNTKCKVTNVGDGLLAEARYDINYKVVIGVINTGYNQGTFNQGNVTVKVRLNGATEWTSLATDESNPSKLGSHEIVLNPDADGNLLFVGTQTSTQAQYLTEVVTIDYKVYINGSLKDIGQFTVKPTF